MEQDQGRIILPFQLPIVLREAGCEDVTAATSALGHCINQEPFLPEPLCSVPVLRLYHQLLFIYGFITAFQSFSFKLFFQSSRVSEERLVKALAMAEYKVSLPLGPLPSLGRILSLCFILLEIKSVSRAPKTRLTFLLLSIVS